jgi:hypothetical protein
MGKIIGGSGADTRHPECVCNRSQQIGCMQRTRRRRVDPFGGEYLAQAAMAVLQPTVVPASQDVGPFAGKTRPFLLPQYPPELNQDA